MSSIATTIEQAPRLDQPDATTGGPAQGRGRRVGVRRHWAVRIAAAVVAIGGLTCISAQTSHAMDIGGGFLNDTYNTPQYWTAPGSYGVQVACSPGLIRIYPYANVQAGYTNGQLITYRYHVTNSAGYVATSGWVGPSVWVPGVKGNWTNPEQFLTSVSWQVRTGVTWTVQVQIAYQTWWGGWDYSTQWAHPVGGYSYNGFGNWARCST